MKTIILKITLLLPALLFCTFIQAQVDLDADDHDFLDPYDDNGDKWFEDVQDRRDFFNDLISSIKYIDDAGNLSEGFISIKDDVFVASIRTDNDFVYDNKNYKTIMIPKGTAELSIPIDGTDLADEITYRIHFFIGANMTEARILVLSNIPSADVSWGGEYVEDEFNLDLISEGALQSFWIELVPVMQSTLSALELFGY